jgi:hypothetical protein
MAMQIIRWIFLLMGFIFDFIILIILNSRLLKKIPNNLFMQALAINDFISLSGFIFDSDNNSGSNNNLCIVYYFTDYTLPAVGAWIVVFISFERLICALFVKKTYFMKKNSYNLIIILFIFLINVFLYILFFIFADYNDKSVKNYSSNVLTNKHNCYFEMSEFYYTISLFDFLNAAVLPFVLMLGCSIGLIISIVKSRFRTNNSKSIKLIKNLKKDVKFSIQILFLDILFLALSIHTYILDILEIHLGTYYFISQILYYLRFLINFFVYLILNSLFRRELKSIFKCNNKIGVIR